MAPSRRQVKIKDSSFPLDDMKVGQEVSKVRINSASQRSGNESSRKVISSHKINAENISKSKSVRQMNGESLLNFAQMELQGPSSKPVQVENEDEPEPQVGNDINNNPNSRLGLPLGFLPPVSKESLISNVLRLTRQSLKAFKDVRESLSQLVAEDDQISKGIKKVDPSEDILQLSLVAEALTILTRDAFVPTHRLNQTAIALYIAEDFLRYPKDIRSFDAILNGRIKLPDSNFNVTTVQKMKVVVDNASDYYNKSNLSGQNGEILQNILFTLMRGFEDLYAAMLGCIQDVFKVLLYTNPREKNNLQEFLFSLTSMERSGMLTEVQDLRRGIDELVIFLEKLSWGSFIVYRLASGKSVTPAKPETATNSNAGVPISPEFPNSKQPADVQKDKGRIKKKLAQPLQTPSLGKPKIKKSLSSIRSNEVEVLGALKQTQLKMKKPKSKIQFKV